MDEDLMTMTMADLIYEVKKLRTGIRYIASQKGDNNCWLDLQNHLFCLLPEKIDFKPDLPSKELMMYNCNRYYDCLKNNKIYIPATELPKENHAN